MTRPEDMETLRKGNDMTTIIPAHEDFAWAHGLFSGLTSDQYHQEQNGLSCTMAKELVFRSPAHMRHAMDHPDPPTKFMSLGNVVHCAFLEPEKLAQEYYVKPSTYPGTDRKKNPVEKKWTRQASYCADWEDAHSDREILSQEEEANALGCLAALKAHPMLSSMLSAGNAEVSCFAEGAGLKLRCRTDLMAQDKDGRTWVVDLKKCQDASASAFASHARTMHYDFQQAWYIHVLSLLDIAPHGFLFAAVEEKPPHGVGLFRVSNENVNAQAANVHRAIDLYRQGVESGEWPGYTPEIRRIGWRHETP